MAKKKTKTKNYDSIGYMEQVHRPILCLVFLLPLVIIYEVGILITASQLSASSASQPIALQIIHRFLMLFGISWFHLPGLAIVVILLVWQIASGESWTINWKVILGMTLESFMLAIPLIVLSNVAANYSSHFILAAANTPQNNWIQHLLLSIGAGIYEEMLFRLVLITFLSIILIDLMNISEGPATFAILIISAVVFSLYHYLGGETFQWHNFVFRMMAGGYLAGIFILRGFGITVGCHVTYDILAFTINSFAHP